MRRILLLTVTAVALTGCGPSDAELRHSIEAFGFHDVTLTGRRWLGCGRDDMFNSGFRAAAANGRPVTGIACGGWGKGITVRLD